jgi:hypothetical protein
MRLAQEKGIAYCIKAADHQSAGIDSPGINMENYRHATFLLQFGALTSNSVLKIYEGETKAEAEAKSEDAIDFSYRLAEAVAAAEKCDTFGDETVIADADSGLTLAAATYEEKLLVVEVDAATLSEGSKYICLEIDNTASKLFVAATAILSEPRYSNEDMLSAIEA